MRTYDQFEFDTVEDAEQDIAERDLAIVELYEEVARLNGMNQDNHPMATATADGLLAKYSEFVRNTIAYYGR